MRKHARDIFHFALRSVDPFDAVCKNVAIKNDILVMGSHRFCLKDYQRILVVGAGKAAAPMAKALESILADYITDGIIIVKDGHGLFLQHIRFFEAGHPIPDERGVEGTTKVLSMVKKAGLRDLVICLISGGGSALLVAPSGEISLDDKQKTTELMLACGAGIHDINAVRKRISKVKGGKLARMAYPATLASLILSDVTGDDLDVIASGPTVPDISTFMQARQILTNFNLWNKVPASVQKHILSGTESEINNTPEKDSLFFDKCINLLVGTNLKALTAAGDRAKQLGYETLILSSRIEGEAREVARVLAAVAIEVTFSKNPVSPPACIICGGETTVTLKGKGKGGRNQELALAFSIAVKGMENIVALFAGTDGTDGPTDAAGAIVDGDTVSRSITSGLDAKAYLDGNNSYPFFKVLNDLVITGPTRTNVMDICIILAGI